MIRLGLTVLDIICFAYRAEDVIDKPSFCSSVMLHELDAFVGEHCVDLVGYCFDQGLEEAGGYKLCGLAINPGDDDFRVAIDCDKQESLATLVSQLCNIDMEIADLVGFEPLGLFTIRLRQTLCAVALQAAMQARTG